MKIPRCLLLSAAIAVAPFPSTGQDAPKVVIEPDRAAASVRLRYPSEAGMTLEETSAVPGTPWTRVNASSRAVGAELEVVVPAREPAGFFRLRREALTTITETSPVDGETGVSVNRETVVHFSSPLAADATLGTNHFYATFGGRRILSRIELGGDRRKATLFYLEPLPGSARVNVFFDSEGLKDAQGRALDPSGSGKAGGFKVIQFDTLSLTPLVQTAVTGRVFASELAPAATPGAAPVNQPLEGVTITVDGMEETLRTTTDAQGSFKLEPVPPGRFFVHIDGRTAKGSSYPDGAYYPFVGKAWDAVAGKTNNPAGGTGEIFLPLIQPETLQSVSATRDTTVGFPASVVAANPALAGVSVTVPANSLFSDNGTRGGRVGIAPVPPDRLPGPLPAGANPALVITVQTDGALNFDQPAPICFPNLRNLKPGEKSALLSFNHKKGEWEIAGSMTVSDDGKLVCTDPGVGILQPGWHGEEPSSAAAGGEPEDPPCEPGKYPSGADEDKCKILSATAGGRNGYCEFYRIDCKQGCGDCLPDIAAYESCIQFCTASYGRCIVRADICPWPPDDLTEGDGGPQRSLHSPTPRSGASLQSLHSSSSAPRLALSAALVSGGNLHHFAIENIARKILVLRGSSVGNGPVLPREALLAPSTDHRLWVVSAATLKVGWIDFTTPTSGRKVALSRVFLWPDYSSDSDADGLSDEAEAIIGTSPNRADSDGDGIFDGAEVQQGLDPLDGLVVRTGVIATARTPGPAVDVWTGNDLVATAEGSAGVSIFNAYSGSNPTMLSHVPTPGGSLRVSGSGDFLVAGCGDAGAVILDISDPGNARILHQVPLAGAQAVAADAARAFVGLKGGGLVVIDLRSGFIRERVGLQGSVEDLIVEGDHLYLLTGDRLDVFSLSGPLLKRAGSVAAPFVAVPNNRLFVGGGIAYTVHNKGYNTINVSNPAQPVLIARGNTAQFGWRQVVANGSGLGLAAVGPNLSDDGSHDVSLYDLSDPARTDRALTTLPTPGLARAVSVLNGLAYVADDAAGFQVVNYLAYDTQGIAPKIELQPGFGAAGVEEGQPTRVTALATDDVQVRNVEFYLDGVRVTSDGNYPFEFRFVSPTITAGKNSFRLRARAFDTGGNSTWSDELTVTLVKDATPPRVISALPGTVVRTISIVTAIFDGPMNAGTINSTSFLLSSAGPDGNFGTEDDVPVPGGTVAYHAENSSATLRYATPLADGIYRAVIKSTVADLAGNAMVGDHTWLLTQVQRWDPVTEFGAGNPSGVWSYGYSDKANGPFNLSTNYFNDGRYAAWGGTSRGPYVLKNLTSATQNDGSRSHAPNQLNLDPSFDGRYAILRFTAPTNSLRVYGRFVGIDTASTDVAVVIGKAIHFAGSITGKGDFEPFDFNFEGIPGEAIDFAVGQGTGGPFFDGTGLEVTIESSLRAPLCAPVPADIALWLPGDGDAVDVAGTNQVQLLQGAGYGQGVVGQAFSLDGLANYVAVSDSPSVRPANQLTVEGWFRFQEPIGPIQVLVGKAVGSSFYDSYALYYQNGELRGAVGNVNSLATPVAVPFRPAPGVWVHLAYTFNDESNAQSLYINGRLAAANTTGLSIGYDDHPVTIGAAYENAQLNFFFRGLADEVSLYSRALSEEELLTIYKARGGKCGLGR